VSKVTNTTLFAFESHCAFMRWVFREVIVVFALKRSIKVMAKSVVIACIVSSNCKKLLKNTMTFQGVFDDNSKVLSRVRTLYFNELNSTLKDLKIRAQPPNINSKYRK
jgi:hypothetical protein